MTTPQMIACPFCAEDIREGAIKCRHCSEFLVDADHLPPQVAQRRGTGELTAPASHGTGDLVALPKQRARTGDLPTAAQPRRGTGQLSASVPAKPQVGSARPGSGSLKKPRLPVYIEYQLTPLLKTELAKLSGPQVTAFIDAFNRKRKNMTSGYISWLLLGSHYAYLGRWGLQVLHWGTFGMMGMWWLLDAVRLPRLIQGHNRDLATSVLRDIKLISQ